MMDLLGNLQVWLEMVVAFGLGAIGGWANVPTPTQAPPGPIAPSIWIRILLGGVAALAVLWLAEPKTALAFLAGSIVAGYGGQAVLNALESRFLLGIAVNTSEEKDKDMRAAMAAVADKEDPRPVIEVLKRKYPLLPPPK